MNQNSNSVFEFCLLFDYHKKIQEKIKILMKIEDSRKTKGREKQKSMKALKQNFNLGELSVLRVLSRYPKSKYVNLRLLEEQQRV